MSQLLSLPPVLVITGPTGIGKTALSLAVASRLPSEIISVDSRQIYRYMDIGTAKPDRETLDTVPHHMIDILDPDAMYSAGQFAADTRQIIGDLLHAGKTPLLVGGSGLYLKAVLDGFYKGDLQDPDVRAALESRAEREGAASLMQELHSMDPQAAAAIHPNNVRRIVRALEMCIVAGKPVSEMQRENRDPAQFDWLKFGLLTERDQLYSRIESRVEQMFELGLTEEVKSLLKRGYSADLNALNSPGYAETIRYLRGDIEFKRCKELVKQNTRHYAKRQLTWFRKEKHIEWLPLDLKSNIPKLAETILEKYRLRSSGR